MVIDNRRRKDDPEFTPMNDPVFRRHSIHFDNLEFQRRFEQNLIRYNLVNSARVTEEINNSVLISGGGGGAESGCYWTKEGSNLVYYEGNVGVGVHPRSNDFEVRGNALVSGVSEAPYVEIRNESDTEYDPILKWSVGATPACMFAMGVDDSDENKLKIANQAALGSALATEFEYGSYIFYFHESKEDIVSILLSDFDTDAIAFNGSAGSGDGQFSSPRKLAFDGIYLYVADDLNNRIQKFHWSTTTFYGKTGTGVVTRPWGLTYWQGYLYASCYSGTRNGNIVKIDAETLLEVSTFGTLGTGDNNFSGPRGLSTDGTYLYICDTQNSRLKKHTLAGAYVAQVGSSGSGNGQFNTLCDCSTDGTYVWAADYGNDRIQVFNCSDLSWVASITTFSQPTVGTGAPGSVTINGTYFYVGCNNNAPYNGYIEKYDMATNTLQDINYPQNGVEGAAPDVIWGMIILEYPSLIGDLIVLHQDGCYLEVYPKTKFMDDIRFYEGIDPVGNYVGLRAPTTVTADYTLTLPAAVAAAQGHLYGTTAGVLAWGQDVNAAASPTFVRLTLSQAIGTAPLTITSTTVVPNLNADMVDGYHASGLGAAIDHGGLLDLSADDHPQYLILAGRGGTYQSVYGGLTSSRSSSYGYTLAMGINALASPSLETWTDNTAFGSLALQACTSGYDNVAVGFKVLNANTTGHLNTGIGTFCLYSNIGGHRNCAFGTSSLELMTGGDDNMGFGYNTLRSNLTGSGSVAIGTYSLYNSTGSRNVSIGYYSGFTRTSGDDSVFLGYKAGYYETGSNKLFIDNAPRASEADGRAKALIYGIFAAATVDQYLYLNAKVSVPQQLTSTLAIGTAPFAVTSTTVCGNLNADMVDGYHQNQSLLTTADVTFDDLTLTGVISAYKSVAEGYVHFIDNDNAGTTAYTVLCLGNTVNANQTHHLRMGVLGTGWTPQGVYLADCAWISSGSNLAGGLLIMAEGYSAIRFATNATERIRVSETGVLRSMISLDDGDLGEMMSFNFPGLPDTYKHSIYTSVSGTAALNIFQIRLCDAGGGGTTQSIGLHLGNSVSGVLTGGNPPEAKFQVGAPAFYGTEVVGNTPVIRAIGGVQSQVTETILRLVRPVSSEVYYGGSVDFNVLAYQAGGYPYTPATQLDICLKNAESYTETANVLAMTLTAQPNVGIGTSAFGTSATKTLAIGSGTAPGSSPADAFQVYSADVVAGNATPHFRTEAGDVVKLYKYVAAALANSADSGDSDTDDLIEALRDLALALGIGAAS